MTSRLPTVDVNLFACNAAETIGAAIESVLAQTWPALTLTVIDNASTDGTPEVVRGYQRSVPWIRLYRARANGGSVANCQRAFTLGDADFVLPKTADDLIEPGFVEAAMGVLLAHPDCAMCHAAGLVFVGQGHVRQVYPAEHRLHAVGPDPAERARHVMARYTSAPSFGAYIAARPSIGWPAFRTGPAGITRCWRSFPYTAKFVMFLQRSTSGATAASRSPGSPGPAPKPHSADSRSRRR